MIEAYVGPNTILLKDPKEDSDDDNSLPETKPYEQQDEPSQNGQDPNSVLKEIGDPLGLPLAEALLAGKRLGDSAVLEVVSMGKGPEENGDESGRDMGEGDEEVVPDPEKESKNLLLVIVDKDEDKKSSNGGNTDKDDAKKRVKESNETGGGEVDDDDVGTGN